MNFIRIKQRKISLTSAQICLVRLFGNGRETPQCIVQNYLTYLIILKFRFNISRHKFLTSIGLVDDLYLNLNILYLMNSSQNYHGCEANTKTRKKPYFSRWDLCHFSVFPRKPRIQDNLVKGPLSSLAFMYNIILRYLINGMKMTYNI